MSYDPDRDPKPVRIRTSHDATLELAHLLGIIEQAARLLDENLADVDANILRAHGAELAAGREWPGMPIRSTTDEAWMERNG